MTSRRTSTLAIVGPTASGKSALAMEIARRTGAQILSADSMQVYRGMDIGTAKPTRQERAEVVHHLIDVVEPSDTFTVARFVEMADAVIENAKSPLIVVGGTPLYYKALFEGLFEGPGANEEIRQRLRSVDVAELHARLKAVDPEAANRIHVNDRKRLERALEVFELTGKPISSFQTDWESGKVRHEAIWVGLAWDRAALNRRINARVQAMMDAGWLDEVSALKVYSGSISKAAREATGYQELFDFFLRNRGQGVGDAVEQIKIATRQLARRQMKWLKRFPNVHWIPGDAPLETQVKEVLARWP
jgi:tRNA dimethylallyltransferase